MVAPGWLAVLSVLLFLPGTLFICLSASLISLLLVSCLMLSLLSLLLILLLNGIRLITALVLYNIILTFFVVMPNCSNRPCYSCKLERCSLFDDGFDTLVINFTFEEYKNLNSFIL